MDAERWKEAGKELESSLADNLRSTWNGWEAREMVAKCPQGSAIYNYSLEFGMAASAKPSVCANVLLFVSS